MTHEELVAAFTELRNETFDQAEARMAQNAEAESAKLRVAQQAQVEISVTSNRDRRVADLEERERQLMAWKKEVDGALREHLKSPCPSHGIERSVWLREHETLVETQQEIEMGAAPMSSGRLREMAARDNAELNPGLRHVRKRLKELRTDMVGATSS
jgi:hypothetical protein